MHRRSIRLFTNARPSVCRAVASSICHPHRPNSTSAVKDEQKPLTGGQIQNLTNNLINKATVPQGSSTASPWSTTEQTLLTTLQNAERKGASLEKSQFDVAGDDPIDDSEGSPNEIMPGTFIETRRYGSNIFSI